MANVGKIVLVREWNTVQTKIERTTRVVPPASNYWLWHGGIRTFDLSQILCSAAGARDLHPIISHSLFAITLPEVYASMHSSHELCRWIKFGPTCFTKGEICSIFYKPDQVRCNILSSSKPTWWTYPQDRSRYAKSSTGMQLFVLINKYHIMIRVWAAWGLSYLGVLNSEAMLAISLSLWCTKASLEGEPEDEAETGLCRQNDE